MAKDAGNGGKSAATHYLRPDQLQIGVFVHLDIPWFKHDFALSAFKIRNEEQIQELRALKLPRYRYDPARSDITENKTPAEIAPVPPAEQVKADEPATEPEPQQASFHKEREQRIKEVEKAFAKATSVMRNLNRNLLANPKETLEQMSAVVNEMVTTFLESPDITLHAMSEKTGGEDIYYHSMNITVLSMMLAKGLGFTPEMAKDMGIGAMLHDIGMMKIPDRIAKKSPEECTMPERNLLAMHVEYGIEIGRQIGLSEGALAIIAQHHEMADGSGFPKGLKTESMTPAGRLVSLVNYYDELCNPFDISKAMTPHDALSLMFAKYRSKFDAQALSLLIRSLGVYPPGTIVQLSNDAIAVIVSVNPENSLRPCALVYDPKIPIEKAIVLDLNREQSISIKKSLQPASLPYKVAAYLCPRKRTAYFFDGNTQTTKS